MQDTSSPALIHPVILSGGSGTRLWPASRKACPKPFLRLIGDATLFEQATGRLAGDARFADPMIVAGAAHLPLITAQMDGAAHRIVVEPMARNTAPAIALAAALLPDDAVMLVCPSDHYIADCAAFRGAAVAAAQLAVRDYLVAFGIAADRPETGYGYLRRGGAIPGGYEIAQFVEKPGLDRARDYLASGEYSWNGGIFAFRAGAVLDELARHRPDMAAAVRDAVAKGRKAGDHFHPDANSFAGIVGESIDYAVMENTSHAAMVSADMGWSDIGNWAALQDALSLNPASQDQARQNGPGNCTHGAADLIDCNNVLAFSDGPRISAVGLENVCIVVSDGEILVTTRGAAQKVGKLPGAVEQ